MMASEPDDSSSDLDEPSSAPISSQADKYPSLNDCRDKCSVPIDKVVFYSGGVLQLR